MGQSADGWLRENQARWDELAALHAGTDLYDLEGLVAGRDDLRPWEDAELGALDGLDVLHLQCHIGTDTVGLARRGARTVGLDFSPAALDVARELATRCGLPIEFVESNVLDSVDALHGRTFDVVYTGVGALGWLPDLRPWAQAVRLLLRPAGMLYLTELHPMWVALGDDGNTLCQHAIGADFERWDEEDGSYAAPQARLNHTVTWERIHTTADVLSAVLEAGLSIELYHEYDVTPAPTPWLEQRADRLFGFRHDQYRFPVTYSLRARHQP
jgi:SAM-dependent methyltransferase